MVGKRGGYAKSEVRRRLLSATTLELVLEKGHRAVTVGEIAARAGVSEPSVFYHFPTKEALLIAALQHWDEENIRPVDQPGAIADMGRRAELGVRRENLVRLYTEMAGAAADPAHPAHAYLQARWQRSMQVISQDIIRLQRDGRAAAHVDAFLAARALLGAWEGLQLQWLHGPEFDIRSELEAVVTAVLHAPAPSTASG